MASFVVGVDGGTTKTIALVADEAGHILGASRGGNSNWTRPDVEIPMRVVVDTVQAALDRASVLGSQVRLGAFALAGADWPEDYERRERVLAQSGIAQRVVVKNDALAGWRASTRQTYGVVVTAGTGSNTAIITPDGTEWCYGYYVRYGGARDMGRDAIDAVLRAEDGRGAPTALAGLVLDKLNYASAEALLKRMIAGELHRDQLLLLCPLVFEAAYQGDEVAAELIVKQGLALAEYATAAIRRFKMQHLAFDVVLAGSVFKGRGPLLIDTIAQAVHRVAPQARIVRPQLEPALGSILLAYDALGLAVTDEMVQNLVRTAPGPEFFSTIERD